MLIFLRMLLKVAVRLSFKFLSWLNEKRDLKKEGFKIFLLQIISAILNSSDSMAVAPSDLVLQDWVLFAEREA